MRTVFIFALLATLAAGCLSDSVDPASSTTQASTSTPTSPSTSSSSSTAATQEGTTAEQGSSTGVSGPRVCKRECDAAFDCCPAGAVACPSPDYPGNYGCEAGLCLPPTCSSDAECEAVTPGATCKTVEGTTQCVVLCESADTCTGNQSCLAVTDDGSPYCRAGCDNGAIVCTTGTCDETTGRCFCEQSGQCIVGFSCAPLGS